MKHTTHSSRRWCSILVLFAVLCASGLAVACSPPDEPWGKASDGLQIRIRQADAPPTNSRDGAGQGAGSGRGVAVLVDMRNVGQKELGFSSVSRMPFIVEVDGIEYRSMSASMINTISKLKAGETQAGVKVMLNSGLRRVDGKYEPLEIKDGKHKVRLGRQGYFADDPQKVVKAWSNEMEITVGK